MSEKRPATDPRKAAQGATPRELPKRFFKSAAIGDVDGGFALLLDGRTAKTPARNMLAVPDRGLAEALAREWDAQVDLIDPGKMPLTRLVNTALDRVSGEMEAVRADIVKHAETDLICYRAEGPASLVDAENLAWIPLTEWAERELGIRLMLAEGIMFVPQDPASLATVGDVIRPYDALRLAALHVATTTTGSVIIALAIARGRLTVGEAWQAANVDEDWQMSLWGRDEEVMARRALHFAELEAAGLILADRPGEP